MMQPLTPGLLETSPSNLDWYDFPKHEQAAAPKRNGKVHGKRSGNLGQRCLGRATDRNVLTAQPALGHAACEPTDCKFFREWIRNRADGHLPLDSRSARARWHTLKSAQTKVWQRLNMVSPQAALNLDDGPLHNEY